MSDPSVYYRPLPGITRESEAVVLGRVYQLVIDSARKRGRLPDKSGPDDAKGGSSASPDK